jgi:hypothetical protein
MCDMRANIFELLRQKPVLALIVATTDAGPLGHLDSRMPTS